MHRPELLLLDEPTFGLDPLMQREVLRLLREAKANGVTVFFSSHILSEVQATAERVAFIRSGRIIDVVQTDLLMGRALRRVHVRFAADVDLEPITNLPGVEVLSADNCRAVTVQVAGQMDGLVKALVRGVQDMLYSF